MYSYAFFLGRKNLISLAELEATLPAAAKIQSVSREFVIVEFSDELKNPQEILNQLGGTIKIAQIVEQIPAQLKLAQSAVTEILKFSYQQNSKKLSYAVSLWSFSQKPEIILRKFLTRLKKELTEAGVKSRFINKNFQNPQTAQLKGEKVPAEGIEINILNDHQNFHIARTIAIQDIDSYSNRDYERPERDPRLGMLPPKLAQILINISGLKKLGADSKNQTIYDPFCGIGTILSEGYLMDFNVIGSDLDQINIIKTQKNLNWLKEQHPHHHGKIKVFQKDVSRIEEANLGQKVEAIISETWLGPPVKTCPADTQIKKTFENIEDLITGFLGRIKDFNNSDPIIVLNILTYFQKPHRFIFPEKIIKKINRLGFEIEPLISSDTINRFDLKCPDQFRLIYSRPDQVVCRSILKLRKI